MKPNHPGNIKNLNPKTTRSQGLVEKQSVHPDNGVLVSREEKRAAETPRTGKARGGGGRHSAGEMTAGKSTLAQALDFAKLCKHQSNGKVNAVLVIVRSLEEGEGIDRWKPDISGGQNYRCVHDRTRHISPSSSSRQHLWEPK